MLKLPLPAGNGGMTVRKAYEQGDRRQKESIAACTKLCAGIPVFCTVFKFTRMICVSKEEPGDLWRMVVYE